MKIYSGFFVLFITGLLVTANLTAQDLRYSKYKWDSIIDFSRYELVKNAEAVMPKNRIILEYQYDKGGELNTYLTVHKQYYLLTGSAVEKLNKIYIAMDDVSDIVDLKARFVSKDHKFTEVDKKNIKTVENLDDKGNYKLFAIEGAAVGGMIEFYYILKKSVEFQGNFFLQNAFPAKNVDFEIITPSNLKMVTKSYNGFPQLRDTLIKETETRSYQASLDSVPALEEERYAAYNPNKMRVEYTLGYNLARNNSRIRSLDDAAHTMYNIYFDYGKKELKGLNNLIKEIDIKDLGEEVAVRKIEDHVKKNFAFIKNAPPESNAIEAILKNKYATESGMIKLFLGLFKVAGFPFEMVVTCDRFDRHFDPKFDGYNYLNDVLIYLPDLKKYIDPSSMFYRLGFIDPKFQDNYALFLKLVQLDDLETFARDLRKIAATDYQFNGDTLIVKASVDASMSSLNFDIHRAMTGEEASFMQPIYNIATEENRVKMIEPYLKLCDNTNIESHLVRNTGPMDLYRKPFIIDGKASATIIENAGKRLVVKAGELIGPQSELYQENKRKLEVENRYNHYYYRVIEFTVPEGYNVSNLEAFNYSVLLDDKNGPSSGFTTKAELKGNKVVIVCEEYYKRLIYPVSLFEQFRNVINAAADFNKKTLILVKK